MFRRIVSVVAMGATVISLGMLVGPGAALAADPPTPTPVAGPAVAPGVPVISPTSGPPGTVISVTSPGCAGIVSAALASQAGDVLAVNESAGDTTSLTVPADTPQGEILVVAGCDVYSENDFNFTTFT